eukprot:4714045-Lingulodinium_polyedra.AAC.1
MMRSYRPFAVAAVSKPYASRVSCELQLWCSHGVREVCDLRAVAAAKGRSDRIVVHGFRNRAQ